MMGNEARFFTFPLELLRESFTNIRGVCGNAIAYAVYSYCNAKDETPDEAFEFFGINGNPNATFEQGEVLCNSFTRPVLVSVNKDIIFDFYQNPKTDFEIIVFCAFCGLRSIIGKKLYAKTNNGLLIARMFGYATAKDFEALRKKPPYYVAYFSTAQKVRYQLTEKIIKRELSLHWGLKYYSNQFKGCYVSFSLEFEALVLRAEKSRKSNLLRQQQEEQKQVIEQIKKQVRGK